MRREKEFEMRKTMKNGLIAGVLALIAVCAGNVTAQDVIVKEGTIGAGSVSPDSRAKVFITDGPDDAEYGYGLLTVTSDASNGTANLYGTMCEYFPDATTSGLGLYKTGAKFNTCPVGTEANIRLYYGLHSHFSPMNGYSTDCMHPRSLWRMGKL